MIVKTLICVLVIHKQTLNNTQNIKGSKQKYIYKHDSESRVHESKREHGMKTNTMQRRADKQTRCRGEQKNKHDTHNAIWNESNGSFQTSGAK
jgi:hypothetical protein